MPNDCNHKWFSIPPLPWRRISTPKNNHLQDLAWCWRTLNGLHIQKRNHFYWAKLEQMRFCDGGGQKTANNFFGHFCQKASETSGQNTPNPKNRLPKSILLSELQELEVRICEQPNSPIIILILLNWFHKFAISMEADQCPLQFWSAFNVMWRSSIFLQ